MDYHLFESCSKKNKTEARSISGETCSFSIQILKTIKRPIVLVTKKKFNSSSESEHEKLSSANISDQLKTTIADTITSRPKLKILT